MSTIEAVRAQQELAEALSQVEDRLTSVRGTAARFPAAHLSPAILESYDGKLAALRWLVGDTGESPVTKTVRDTAPTYGQVAVEAGAAGKILFPGVPRTEPPTGIPSYAWLKSVQSTLHWALGWFDEPHPAKA